MLPISQVTVRELSSYPRSDAPKRTKDLHTIVASNSLVKMDLLVSCINQVRRNHGNWRVVMGFGEPGDRRGAILRNASNTDLFDESPSLRNVLTLLYAASRAYARAVRDALRETGRFSYPTLSPWTLEQVLDPNFPPDLHDPVSA